MSVTEARPDLAAHTRAVRASFPELVAELRSVLGARLVAYLGSVKETRAVRQWADGEREPSEEVRSRLRTALQVALPLAEAESPEIAQAWFQGLNPQLDDRSPARDPARQEAAAAKNAAPANTIDGGHRCPAGGGRRTEVHRLPDRSANRSRPPDPAIARRVR